MNDLDDWTSPKKRSFRQENNEIIVSKGESARDEIALDSEHYVESEYNENEIGRESVEYEDEDMRNYEPIGLENILDGICECLEPTVQTKDLEDASGRVIESSPPIDIVVEFIERMKNEFSTDEYVIPKVPGIGPPVSPETVTAVGLWLTECSRRQEGQVAPRNLRHFMCPNLDGKLSCVNYDRVFCRRDESSLFSMTE